MAVHLAIEGVDIKIDLFGSMAHGIEQVVLRIKIGEDELARDIGLQQRWRTIQQPR